jgi:predicted component of type VI protein secretion system
MVYLKIIGGERDGEQFELDRDEALIGRAPDCFISIDDPAVSSRHCAVLRDGETFVLRDLDSTNGTRVNGNRVREVQLNPRDVISMGSVQIVIDGDGISGIQPSATPTVTHRAADAPIAARASGVGVDAPFGTRKARGSFWTVIGVLTVLVLAGLLYWFLSGLFKG